VTKYLLPDARPDATIIGAEPMPNASRLAADDRRQNMLYDIEQTPTHRRQHSSAARYRIAYEIDRHPVEEVLIAIETSTSEERRGYLERSVVSVTAARAPRGQFDSLDAQFVGMARSIVADESWMSHETEFLRQSVDKQRATMAAAMKRGMPTGASEREAWTRPLSRPSLAR
jgi:hypothetical protein